MPFRMRPRPSRPGKDAKSSQTHTTRLNLQRLEAREVPAAGLGAASDYSAFILHDFNGYYSDIQGRLAVAGNASITGYAVGDKLADSDGARDDLVVGGDLTFTNGQVFYGNVVYGGTGTFDQFGHPNGDIRQGSTIDFAAAATELTGLSKYWGTLAKTGTVKNQWGIVTLCGTNPGRNVFNLTAAQLWNANTLNIKAPAGSTVLVNVFGAQARMQFMGIFLQGGVDKDHVVFNFPQATKVTLQGIGVLGSVMAPNAAVDFSNGNIQGTLVASSWSGYGEIEIANPTLNLPKPCGCSANRFSNVSGLVYHDVNNDGVADVSEARLAGVTVTLTGWDSYGNTVSLTTTTDGGGIYNFGSLRPGTYTLKVTTPAGYMAGKSSTGAFGGIATPNQVSGIKVPSAKDSGGYNFGQFVCD
jgi:choice-of-anchor A domain-containing protein